MRKTTRILRLFTNSAVQCLLAVAELIVQFHFKLMGPAVILSFLLGFSLAFKWAMKSAALAIISGRIKLP